MAVMNSKWYEEDIRKHMSISVANYPNKSIL